MVRRSGLHVLVALVVVATAALALASAGGARGTAVGCGTLVTGDLILMKNLTGCPSDGLVVMPGVTVDLNGHSIRGSGAGSGIRVSGGDCPQSAPATPTVSTAIKNGTIDGFALGVEFASYCPVALTGLVIEHNSIGVAFAEDGSARQTIQNSSITGNSGDGVRMYVNNRVTVSNSMITLNGGAGVSAPLYDDGSYSGNTIVGNAGPGISVTDSTSQFTNNVVTDNGGGGILAVEGADPFVVASYSFTGNNVSRNGGLGLSALATCFDCAGVPGMTDGGGNVAIGNSDSRQCLNITCGAPRDCGTATLQAGLRALPGAAADKNGGGSAEAFQTSASATGTATTTCIFLDRSNLARQLVAGIYADAGGRPGALLAQGMTPSVSNGAFNTVWLPAVPLRAGTTYWIAVLSPQGAGALRVKDHCCGNQAFSPAGASALSLDASLVALAPTWTSGAHWPNDGPLLGWAGG
jgi:hypothetical protein